MAMEKSLVLLILALFLLLSSATAESRPIIQTTETSPNAQSNEQLSSGLSSPLVSYFFPLISLEKNDTFVKTHTHIYI